MVLRLFTTIVSVNVSPSNKTSKEATEALVRELLDEKKATYKYLSVSESEYSAAHNNFESRQETLLGVHATNDEAESVLGGITSNIRKYGRINLSSASAVIRAIKKEFSLSANYPKGHGELFLEWIHEHYSGVLLLHVERATGSCQDLCTKGCLAIYMNYKYYVEFLDEMLCKKVGQASILQQNLFVILTSAEMLALS